MSKATAEIAKRESNTALERPAFIKTGDLRGAETIGTNDIRPPALRLAQAMSPQVKRSDPAYIDGLQEGDLYNSLTGENLGQGPLTIAVLKFLGHRHVEFAPLNEGGGVVDFAVPDGDPRTLFTSEKVDGRETRIKPKATKFYDYLGIVLPDNRPPTLTDLLALSMKGTQLKVATKLNTLIKLAQVPSFALKFEVRAVSEKKGTYTYFNWRFDRKGWFDEATFNALSAIHDGLADKTIDLSQATEGESADAEDTDIPF